MIETFPSRDALADATADALTEILTAPGVGPLVCAGGSTPGPVYDRLATRDLPWDRLAVTLTDERWVDPTSDESNEKLIRQRLLTGSAARATFLPLKGDGASPEADAAAANTRLRDVPPWSAVLLGMGADGHVASLFPGSSALAAGLDFDAPDLVIAVDQAGLEPFVPRITLTARALVRAGVIIFLVSGEEKRTVIDRIATDPGYAPPAAAFLRQTRCPVRVMWAG